MDDFLKLVKVEAPEETLPSPREVTYWKCASKRIFFIDFTIDDGYDLFELGKTIIQMNAEEALYPEKELKPIYIYIMTYGGDLDQAKFMCDLIEASRIPIVTIAAGVAMSAGFLILLAGKRRYAFEHSRLLVHQGDASLAGRASDLKEASKDYQDTLNKMRDYILSHSKIDRKTLDKNWKRDWYLNKEDIVKYEIATIIDSLGAIV